MAIAASLVVRLSTEYGSFVRGMKDAEKTVNGFSRKATKLGRDLTTELTLPIAAVSVVLYKAVADLERSERAFEASFGTMATAAQAWSEETARALQLDAEDLRGTMAGFQQLATSMGMSERAGALMSQRLTTLALDLQAFRNISAEESSSAIEGALAGRTRGLVRLGIVMQDTDVEQTALRLGMVRAGQTMSDQQAVIARYLTILDKARLVHGEFARSSTSPAVMLIKLRSTITDAAEELGKAFLPAMQRAMEKALQLAQRLRDMAAHFATMPGWVRGSVAALAGLAASIGPVLIAVGSLVALLPKLRSMMVLVFMTPVGRVITAALAALWSFKQYWTLIANEVERAANASRRVSVGERWAAAVAGASRPAGLTPTSPRAKTPEEELRDAMRAAERERRRLEALQRAEEVRARQKAKPGEYQALEAAAGKIDAVKAGLKPLMADFKALSVIVTTWAAEMDANAARVEDRFARMAETVADSLTGLFSDVLMGQADAFKRFLNSIERMMADFIARLAVQRIGETIAEKLLGSYAPLGSAVGGRTAALIGTGTPAAVTTGGDTFHVNVTFAPSLIDARSGAAWLRENEGTITEAVLSGVRKSAAARAALVRG